MGLERTWRARRRDTRLSLCVYSSYADISLLKECQLQALQASRITNTIEPARPGPDRRKPPWGISGPLAARRSLHPALVSVLRSYFPK